VSVNQAWDRFVAKEYASTWDGEPSEEVKGAFCCGYLARNTRAMVSEFHAAFDVKDEKTPCVPETVLDCGAVIEAGNGHLLKALGLFRAAASQDVRALRLALITEELAELASALVARDSTQMLDALCDLQYVLDGSVLAFGMDGVADEGFRRVHRSNMSKLGADGKPVKNETGKIVKGPAYVPVKLEDLVR
jgi:predicted HAD superfamily Cof-like phosphohydrolase